MCLSKEREASHNVEVTNFSSVFIRANVRVVLTMSAACSKPFRCINSVKSHHTPTREEL